MAVNMQAPATTANAKKRAAPAPMPTFDDRPIAMVMIPVVTRSATSPIAMASSASAAERLLVVRPASRSSHRPASSSPRIILVLVRMPQTAAVMARTVRHFQAVNPGTVSIWIAGPTSALMPVLAPNS